MNPIPLEDYVDVAERIRLFYERYPDGRLVTAEHGKYEVDGRTFVYCKAQAFRDPDDPQPCDGLAWEPMPGPTPFTRDSEMMNSQTAAWGRAIIAVGIPSKKIASAEEVQARQMPQEGSEQPQEPKLATKAQHAKLNAMLSEADGEGVTIPAYLGAEFDSWLDYCRAVSINLFGVKTRKNLTTAQMSKLIDEMEKATVPFG